jgi:HD-GYP domain-containing protein (c-di-GMP phosphodiesterase class II)
MDQHWLISRTGTNDVRFRLQAPGPVRVGRSTTNALVLPDVAVSREHALLEWVPDGAGRGTWRVVDRGSSSGTRVNGVPLRAYQSLPLESGDRVDFGPVALEFIVRGGDQPASTIISDAAGSETEYVAPVAPAALTAGQLEAVLAASQDIHLAENEDAVARATVDSLASATGFEDVAFIRPSADLSDIRVLAARGPDAGRQRFSRSVLRRALTGPVIIGDQQQDMGQTVAQSIAAFNQRQCICVPVDLGDRLFGMLYLADHGQNQVPVETLAALARSIGRVAALAMSNMERSRMAQRLEAEQRAMFDGTLQALIAAIDAKDPYTRGHSARVSEYAWLIARAAGLSDQESARARLCGLVHDIGKIGVSEAVLRKTDRLTEEEFREIAAHPVIGHEILKGIPQMADLLPGVLEHHERYDGRGYPNGTPGPSISLLGRLVAVADALDAMTTNRTYRKARPMPEAVAEVLRCSGVHFDPGFAEALARVDARELQRVVGAHVMSGLPDVAPPAHAKPHTDFLGTPAKG